jgi:heme-degrading monooxygenase HmoA
VITEIAILTIDPLKAGEFEAAVERATPAFRTASGCHGMALERVIEDPSRYHLMVQWDSVDHHMVQFRESDGFRVWRGNVGEFFVAPPVVLHTLLVARHYQDFQGAQQMQWSPR